MREALTTRREALLIVACALCAYAAILLGTLVYDDLHTVRDNTAITTLANVPRFFVDVDMFSALECRMYRPVVLVTYAVDWAIGQGAVLPFKLTNLALHVGVALVLHRLMRGLGCASAAALLAACVYAAHPLASEAVNTISGRSELLVALGLGSGLCLHLRAMQQPIWTVGVAGCAALACGSKEIGVVLPALLMVLDPPPLRSWSAGRAWLVRHVPVVLVVFGYLLVRRELFGHATAALPPLVGGDQPMAGHGRDLVTQLCTMATLLPKALAQCVVPLGLTLDPPSRFVREPSSPRVLCGVVFVGGLTWLALRRGWRAPVARLGVALAWFTALPWIVLPLNVPYLEHRMYVPMLGLAVLLAVAAERRWRAESERVPGGRVLAGLILVTFCALASRRSLEYRNPTRMWERLVAAQPSSVRGLGGLAMCHMEANELEAALPLVQRAVALWPTHASALRNLAELHLKLSPSPGNAMTALIAAETVCALSPDNPFDCLLRSRALALAAESTGYAPWYDAAEAAALRCLEIAPPKSLVYRTAASARLRQGDLERGLALLDRALASGLGHVPVLLDRADFLRRLGRAAEADAQLQRAIQAHPFDPAVLRYVGSRLRATPPAKPD